MTAETITLSDFLRGLAQSRAADDEDLSAGTLRSMLRDYRAHAQRLLADDAHAADVRAAVEAERARCAKEIEASAAHLSEDEDPGSVRYDWSMHLAVVIRTPTTEAAHDRR